MTTARAFARWLDRPESSTGATLEYVGAALFFVYIAVLLMGWLP